MLRPKDIKEVQFGRAFKGYNSDEVDQFLDRVLEDYAALFRENAELVRKLEILADKVQEYQNSDEKLRAAKEKIFRLAEEMAANAKAEAARIEREAREKADRILIDAKRDAEKERRGYERLQLEVSRFRAKAIHLLKNEIEHISALPNLQVSPQENIRIQADDLYEDELETPFITQLTREKAEEPAQSAPAPAFVPEPEPQIPPIAPAEPERPKVEPIEDILKRQAKDKPAFTIRIREKEPEETPQQSAPEKQAEEKAIDVPPAAQPAEQPAPAQQSPAQESDSITAEEIFSGPLEDAAVEEFEDVEVIDTEVPEEKPARAQSKIAEHPKFGEIRFGAGYDVVEDELDDKRPPRFWKKK